MFCFFGKRHRETLEGEGVLTNELNVNVYAYFPLLHMLIVNISKIIEL